VRIERAGPTMELDVEVFPRADRTTCYRLRFIGVAGLELMAANEQNVLFDLSAIEDAGEWSVRVDPSYGIGATFRCRQIESFVLP